MAPEQRGFSLVLVVIAGLSLWREIVLYGRRKKGTAHLSLLDPETTERW